MKKLIICVVIILTLCGCENKKSDKYEHYQLSDSYYNKYVYVNNKNKEEIYALKDMTEEEYQSVITGLFYKVGNDDYILLDKLESLITDASNQKSVYQFYEDKLYGLGSGNTPITFEYQLNGTKSKLKELNFKVEDTSIYPTALIEIKNNSIILKGYIKSQEQETRTLICSLDNYNCTITDNN